MRYIPNSDGFCYGVLIVKTADDGCLFSSLVCSIRWGLKYVKKSIVIVKTNKPGFIHHFDKSMNEMEIYSNILHICKYLGCNLSWPPTHSSWMLYVIFKYYCLELLVVREDLISSTVWLLPPVAQGWTILNDATIWVGSTNTTLTSLPWIMRLICIIIPTSCY